MVSWLEISFQFDRVICHLFCSFCNPIFKFRCIPGASNIYGPRSTKILRSSLCRILVEIGVAFVVWLILAFGIFHPFVVVSTFVFANKSCFILKKENHDYCYGFSHLNLLIGSMSLLLLGEWVI